MLAHESLSRVAAFLVDAERLKLVERRAYVSNCSRRENSAEHSWHLALGLLTIARELKVEIDLPKALRMSIIHDVCEIDAGDTPAYGPARCDQHEAEARCVERLRGYGADRVASIVPSEITCGHTGSAAPVQTVLKYVRIGAILARIIVAIDATASIITSLRTIRRDSKRK